MHGPATCLLLFLFGATGRLASASDAWNAENMMNPLRRHEYCNMKEKASVCDPDRILTEIQRIRLNSDLQLLESRTKQPGGRSCDVNGVKAVVLVVQNIQGGLKADADYITDKLRQKWEIDTTCQKDVVLLLSTNDTVFSGSSGDGVSLSDFEFMLMFNAQKDNMRQKRYQDVLTNIVQAIDDKLNTVVRSKPSTIQWNAENYPNPASAQYQLCNVNDFANLCDPDNVLEESQRYRLDTDLKQLETRTQHSVSDPCERKGITGSMALARRIQGGKAKDAERMANNLLRRWRTKRNETCEKSIVLVVAVEDQVFWVARGKDVPIKDAEFTKLFSNEKKNFKEGRYQYALSNIVQQVWEIAAEKSNTSSEDLNLEDMSVEQIVGLVIFLVLMVAIAIVVFLYVKPTCTCHGRGYRAGNTEDRSNNCTVAFSKDNRSRAGNETGCGASDGAQSRGGGGGSWADS